MLAELMMQLEPVPDVSRDTTLPTEPVFSPPPILKAQLWSDAKSGTGMLKLAQNALLSGSSTLTVSVLRSQLSVLPTMPMEPVPDATVDSP